MKTDVLSFGEDCNSILSAAVSGTGITTYYTPFEHGPTNALQKASIKINSGDAKVILCTVSPLAPLAPLDLLSAVKDATSECVFFLYAATQEVLDVAVSASDKKKACDMGLTSFLIVHAPDDLLRELERALGLRPSPTVPPSVIALDDNVAKPAKDGSKGNVNT